MDGELSPLAHSLTLPSSLTHSLTCCPPLLLTHSPAALSGTLTHLY